jgi:acyl-CoA synthetase (AMP-forming)/AMP-acid ligase II
VPAVVVRLCEGSRLTEEDLLAWGRDHLAQYKAPRLARIVDTLPRTGTDKVAKRMLLALFAA